MPFAGELKPAAVDPKIEELVDGTGVNGWHRGLPQPIGAECNSLIIQVLVLHQNFTSAFTAASLSSLTNHGQLRDCRQYPAEEKKFDEDNLPEIRVRHRRTGPFFYDGSQRIGNVRLTQ